MATSSIDIGEPSCDFTLVIGVGFMFILHRNTVELWVLHASSRAHQVDTSKEIQSNRIKILKVHLWTR